MAQNLGARHLVTAPVLAIVMYNLLYLVEHNLAKSIPIVALIAFASGLLSETVLGTISEKAKAYLLKVKAASESEKKTTTT